LGAGLRIGGDAARIIVGGAGDEAGSETVEKAAAEGFHVGGLLKTQVHDDFLSRSRGGGNPVAYGKKTLGPRLRGDDERFADAVTYFPIVSW
jgi:hypothetical protein